MKEQLITLKTAKLAKNKGFNELCEYSYEGEILSRTVKPWNNSEDESEYAVCTQSLLQRWLREVHNMFLTVEYSLDKDDWFYYLYKQQFNKYIHFKTYEEALEAGLYEALLLIK